MARSLATCFDQPMVRSRRSGPPHRADPVIDHGKYVVVHRGKRRVLHIFNSDSVQ